MSGIDYDGIVLGSGHNSLVLQAYMGKAGMKVLCLERSATAGGGLATVEDPAHPGFLHNTHSFYHRALTQMPCPRVSRGPSRPSLWICRTAVVPLRRRAYSF